MAVTARRMGAAVEPRPRLSLVRPPAARRRATGGAAEVARWRSRFRSYLILMALLAAVACGRLVLTTRAAEASLSSVGITQDIQAERVAADKLEVSRSSLTTPGRIRDIAGTSLQMVEPGEVEYLDLPNETAAAEPSSDGGLMGAVSAAMDLAAGEAQALLVGDVGLASAR